MEKKLQILMFNVYDFCFLVNVHSFNLLTPTFESDKNVSSDVVGVDFSFKQPSITVNVVIVGSMQASSISMFFSMLNVAVN